MTRRRRFEQSLALAVCLGFPHATNAGDLSLPLACDVGSTCFIQNYVDIDDSPSAKDYMCGTLTYDGHNGVDFRIPSNGPQQKSVAVLAAADAKVLRVRDGLVDRPVKGDRRDAVSGQECGNGVVIEHAGNRETQYCHMAKGSILVKSGDTIRAGQALGSVGMSGLTEYPHLHFVLRREGKVIDPFGGIPLAGVCERSAESEWTEDVRARLAYVPRVVLNHGFSTEAITNELIEDGIAAQRQPTANAEALVAYVRTIGLKAGDSHTLAMRDPDGKVIAENRPAAIARNQAQAILFAGKKRSDRNWPRGTYTGTYTVDRSGETVLQHRFQLDLQ